MTAKIALSAAGFVNIITDQSVWGFMWLNSSLDDRVTFINDLPDTELGYAPVGSKRSAYLDKIRPFECSYDVSSVNWISNDVNYLADTTTASHVTNPLWLQMVRTPSIYVFSTTSNGYEIRLFSERFHEGWDYIPSFAWPRYKGTTYSDGGVTKLVSYANLQNPTASISEITAAGYANATNASIGSVTMMWHYYLMTMLMTADIGRFNAQVFWTGATEAADTYATSIPCGKTNAMTTPNGNSASYVVGAYTIVPFRWRFIENFFGGTWNILSGAYRVHLTSGATILQNYIAKTRAQLTTNDVYSGYTYMGDSPWSNNYVQEFLKGTIFPSVLGGSTTTGKCDYSYMDGTAAAHVRSVMVGGNSNRGGAAGPFYVNSSWNPSDANVNVGVSLELTELPEAVATA